MRPSHNSIYVANSVEVWINISHNLSKFPLHINAFTPTHRARNTSAWRSSRTASSLQLTSKLRVALHHIYNSMTHVTNALKIWPQLFHVNLPHEHHHHHHQYRGHMVTHASNNCERVLNKNTNGCVHADMSIFNQGIYTFHPDIEAT